MYILSEYTYVYTTCDTFLDINNNSHLAFKYIYIYIKKKHDLLISLCVSCI